MHILITVFFNAQQGGLHNNIYSTIRYLLDNKHQVTIVCKPGPFATMLEKQGVSVIQTDYKDIDAVVETLTSNDYKFDLVHTHPFYSRIIAEKVSKTLGIPLLITYHGMYEDDIANNIHVADTIFTVSEALRDYLVSRLPDKQNLEIIKVLPNGVNLKLFKPVDKLPYFQKRKVHSFKKQTSKLNITFVSRLDQDKIFILERLLEAIRFTNDSYADKTKWTIVGDGSLLHDIQSQVSSIVEESGHEVQFVGWKEETDLPIYYQTSDVIIAPGRCALEGMACGKPVIAIGSQAYIGLITYDNWKKGVYTNFGGFGFKNDDYSGQIVDDLRSVIDNSNLRSRLKVLGESVTRNYFDEQSINHRLFEYYKLALKS